MPRRALWGRIYTLLRFRSCKKVVVDEALAGVLVCIPIEVVGRPVRFRGWEIVPRWKRWELEGEAQVHPPNKVPKGNNRWRQCRRVLDRLGDRQAAIQDLGDLGGGLLPP